MPFGSWMVENLVRINVVGLQNLERMSGAASAADVRFARLTGQISSQEAAWLRYRRQVDAARESQQAMLTTAAFGTFVVLGAALAYAVKGASDLQTAITGVQIATNQLNPAAGDAYARLAIKVSSQTAQDAVTIAQELATAATSGLNDPRKLKEGFPRIAKAADVLWMSPKHTDPIESVRIMSQLAHLFGVYEGAPLQHMLDRAVEMQFVQPEAIQQLVTQGRLFLPSAMSAGVSEQDIWKQAMTMGQTGFLRSRGGSGLANIIEALAGATAITGHLSKAQRKAMGQLGLEGPNGLLDSRFHDAKGDLLLQKVVDHLEAVRQNTAPTTFLAEVTNAFQKQGGRYMSDILIPRIYQKAQQNWESMNKMGGVDKMWGQYTHNFRYQWNVFTTNLENLFRVVALPMLPGLTSFIGAFGAALGWLVSVLADHPTVAGTLGYLTLGLVTFLGVVSAVGGITQALRFPNAFLLTIGPIRALVGAISALQIGESAAGETYTVAQALRALAGAGAAFMASPLGMLISAAGVMLGTTSFDPVGEKQRWAQILNWSGGPKSGYSKYLKQHGITTSSQYYESQSGAHHIENPQQFWDQRHPWKGFGPSGKSSSTVSVTVPKIEITIHDATDPAKVAMVVKSVLTDLFSNPRSAMGTSAFNTRTTANLPVALSVPPA
jgi:TP901 family phage tail tape measure protein